MHNASQSGLTSDQQALLAQLLQKKGIQLPQSHTIPRRSSNAPCPLSFAQQRLWFLHQLNPEQGIYNVPTALRLHGSLNIAALTQSFNTIIARHEVLRTHFITNEDGEPLQEIVPHLSVMLPVLDWRHLDVNQQEENVQQLAQIEAQRSFDLERGPLVRGTLIHLQADEYVLLVTLHHIVCDGWSTAILVKELATLYSAYNCGEAAPLPELSLQYADFALWQRQQLTNEKFTSQLQFWQKQLADAPAVLELPTDFPRLATTTHRGAKQRQCFSPSLTQKLKALSQQGGTTLFMTLLAAFKVLLYGYTAQRDILVGTPIANRDRAELEGLIGFFANTLVLRTDLGGNPRFTELLAQVRQQTLAAYEHQNIPFEKLVEVLQPNRNLNHQPLFQVMFAFANTPTEPLTLPGLTLTPLRVDNPTAKFDLTLFMEETEQGLQAILEYDCDLFKSATITRMLGHLEVLLQGIVKNPQARLSELPLLTCEETQQLLQTWNHTQVNYEEICVHQWVEQQALKNPHNLAVVFAGETLTYSQLNTQANQLAHYLRSLGVQPETKVGICLEPSLNMAIAVLAILKAGAAYVPLDPNYPEDRLSHILSDTQAFVLVTQQDLVPKLPSHKAKILTLDTHSIIISQQSPDNVNSQVKPENLAYIIYTSGSTGKPKGICLSHLALANLLHWHFSTLLTGVRTLQFASLNFDASFHEMFATWGTGGTLYLIPALLRTDTSQLIAFLAKNRIEKAIFPVVVLQQIAELVANTPQSLADLKEVTATGEQLQITPAIRALFNALPDCRLHNHYGPSETHVVTAYELPANCQQWSTHPSIGRPIANTQIYLLNEHLQPVPVCVPGELYLGGVSLARGYLNRPELTAAKFIPSPFDPSQRLYRTGDLARYLPDGNLEYLGRLDSQVKIRGFRIEMAEIEAVLLRYQAVQEILVMAQTSDVGDKALVAYVIPTPETSPTVSQLREFLGKTLPDYMIPAAFVFLDAFPLNPNGKIDRQALPKPTNQRPELEADFVPPRNPIESKLAQIWCQVLGIEQVGIYDNFFELGGHSLLTTQLILHIRKAFHLDFPLRSLFESPTVAEIAARIASPHIEMSSASLYDLLSADAQLDPTIQRCTKITAPISHPQEILLTGATGFLGAFLLSELLAQTSARLHCLVRAKNCEDGMNRIRCALESYLLWQDNWENRIIPVLGDLAQPYLGLSPFNFQHLVQTIEVIYHNGAWVHHIYPYSVLKAANVLGTQEVLRLACAEQPKPVHFISTPGVFSGAGSTGVQVVREGESLHRGSLPTGGYSQTKWVAELLVQEAGNRGLPVYIYRPGRISGHSQTGVFNPNDFLYRLIIGCTQLGAVPNGGIEIDIIPIDYASQAIVYLSQNALPDQAFHLVNPHPASSCVLVDVIRTFSYPLETVPFEQWQAQLHQMAQEDPNHPVSAIASFFSTSESEESPPAAVLKFDTQNTMTALKDTLIQCPPVNEQLLNQYIAYLVKQGFLSFPS